MQDQSQSANPGEEPEYEGQSHDWYRAKWREWVDNYKEARAQSFRDQEYYDGDVKGTGEGHWLSTQLKILKDRKQPPSVFNLIKRKINAIAGVEQRARAEPRALPRTPKDQYAAEICTDSLRYVKEQTRLPMTSATGFLDMLIAGYTASLVEGAEDSVNETLIEWRDFFFDPASRMWDFSDAAYMGVAKWVDVDVAKATYVPPELPPFPSLQQWAEQHIPPEPVGDPMLMQQWVQSAQAAIAQYQAEAKRYEAEKKRREEILRVIESTAAGGKGHELADTDYDDHPLEHFGDERRQRIFIVDMWHRDAKKGWYRCVFTGQGKLFTEEASLIEKDQWGRTVKTHPIKAASLYVSKDGWRYGEVRGMRSPQDEVNMRRSKALHLLTVRQILYSPRAGIAEGNVEKMRAELARPDGVIEAQDITQIKIESNMDLAQGQQQLGAEARAFMEMEGPNPQLQGEQGRATSGRAVLALQQAGLGQLGPIFDRFHDWEDRRYRAMWFRIQQFWRGPMYVRVTDDKNAAKFAAVNGAAMLDERGQPKRRRPPEASMMAPQPQGPNGPPMGAGALQSPNGMMMQPGGSDMAPMLGHNGGPEIDPNEFETGPMLAELDMDIIIDRAPEAATLQAEQFQELSQLAQSGVLGPPSPETARMIITASALPTKTQLLDMLDKAAAKPQGPSPEQKAALAKLAKEIERIVAQTDKTKAETAKIAAEIPGARADAALTAAQARTENVNATMTEFSAQDALALRDWMNAGGAPAYAFAPQAAADPLSGAPGLPPIPANGPPPF